MSIRRIRRKIANECKEGEVRRVYHKRANKGYVLVRYRNPITNKIQYIGKHRLVMQQFIGRLLESHEHIHHKNKIRNDNRIENLELVMAVDHDMINTQGITCPFCKHKFKIR